MLHNLNGDKMLVDTLGRRTHPWSRIILCQKLESFSSILMTVTVGLASVSSMALKASVLGEMMQDSDHYAVEGHSRSAVSVPVCNFL